jgi:DNA (cytosine-5)-methyltransferase 1
MATFYEFFAGGGMARAGLGKDWQCVFANDFDEKKAAAYRINWGGEHFKVADVASLTVDDLPPGTADLAWASFPCQDLSLAGNYAGLSGRRSGTFWAFWDLVRTLNDESRAPHLIVLENVCGALTSHGGRDFAAIGSAVATAGYHFGAVVIDAAKFLPHSRPRLFIIASRSAEIPRELQLSRPDPAWHTDRVIAARSSLAPQAKRAWVWWKLPSPATGESKLRLADIVESGSGVKWSPATDTRRILGMMSSVNRRKVEVAQSAGGIQVGAVYRRTRTGVQRAEVRFDGLAGCLRTPAGGSSRQTLLIVSGQRVRSRLLSAREAARLMGLPDSYRLPANYNDAYHLAGDGVVVPVVRFLSENLLTPLIRKSN